MSRCCVSLFAADKVVQSDSLLNLMGVSVFLLSWAGALMM
jgi:hypothetical protein